MSTSSIYNVRLAFLSLATLSASSVGFAQSTLPSDKSVAAKQTADPVACASDVRPIQRAKKPSKPISADWTTMPSTYTHDATGQRVDQFALAVEPQSNERTDFVRSGFRHSRSTLQAGFSADNYHVTEQWGQPVRPYGEWRYPNRPFSVPYGQWGPQLPQVVVGGNQWGPIVTRELNPGMNGPGMNGPGMNGPGMNGPGMNGPGMNGPGMNGPGNNAGGGAMVRNQPGMGPGWNGGPMPWPGNPNGNGNGPWNQGPWNQGNGGGFGGLGVGPGNTLPAGQDEYYQQAPTYHPMSADGFQSPFRN